jgi:hypothetical protein
VRVEHRGGVAPFLVGDHGKFDTALKQSGQRLAHLGVQVAAGAAALLVVHVKLGQVGGQQCVGAHRLNGSVLHIGQRGDEQLAGAVADPVVDLLLRHLVPAQSGAACRSPRP